MKRLNKGLLVTSGICGGLGLALLICGMLLGGIRGGNDLVDALSINSGDFQEMKDALMQYIQGQQWGILAKSYISQWKSMN